MILGGLGRGLGGLGPHFLGLGAAIGACWLRPDVLASLAGWLGWLAEAPRIQGRPSGGGEDMIQGRYTTIRQQAADCKLQSDS